MGTTRVLVMLLSVAVWSHSLGSEHIPCSTFVSADGHSFLLHDAYRAADLVAIGQVAYGAKPTLKIKMRIKGEERANEVELTSNRCQGTACSGGFSVAPKVDFLFLLRRRDSGIYDSVTGNGNRSCPVVYEVENESVKIRDKAVPVRGLENYFQSGPDPVPLY